MPDGDQSPATTAPATDPGPTADGMAGLGREKHAGRLREKMKFPPTVADLLATAPGCWEAVNFKNKFEPREGVDYGWVVEYAKDRYAAAMTSFKELDDKAASVIATLGGGTGLLTLGSLVAAATGKIHYLVAAAAVLPISLAAAALFSAIRARETVVVAAPPTVEAATKYADHFEADAEAAFLGQWHLCLAFIKPVLQRKARWVNKALWFLFTAVLAMLIPLGVLIVQLMRA